MHADLMRATGVQRALDEARPPAVSRSTRQVVFDSRKCSVEFRGAPGQDRHHLALHRMAPPSPRRPCRFAFANFSRRQREVNLGHLPAGELPGEGLMRHVRFSPRRGNRWFPCRAGARCPAAVRRRCPRAPGNDGARHLTSVPLQLPAAGWTTRNPAGLLMTMRSSSSKSTSSAMSSAVVVVGTGGGSSSRMASPARNRAFGLVGAPLRVT